MLFYNIWNIVLYGTSTFIILGTPLILALHVGIFPRQRRDSAKILFLGRLRAQFSVTFPPLSGTADGPHLPPVAPAAQPSPYIA